MNFRVKFLREACDEIQNADNHALSYASACDVRAGTSVVMEVFNPVRMIMYAVIFDGLGED